MATKLKRSAAVRDDGVAVLVDGESGEALLRQRQELQTLQADAERESARLVEQVEHAETFEASENLREESAAAMRRAKWIAARLPQIDERLAKARSKEHIEKAARHLAIRRAVFQKLRAALESAARLQSEAIAADADACQDMGESNARAAVPIIAFRGILREDAVVQWAAWCQTALGTEPAARVVRPTAPARTVTVAETSGASGSQRAVSLADDPSVPTYAERLPDDLAPLEQGQVRAQVLRSGYPDFRGRQSHRGRKIRVNASDAAVAQGKGAIDVLDAGNTALPVGARIGPIDDLGNDSTFKKVLA